MTLKKLTVLSVFAFTTPTSAGDEFQLPPEVTPALRAACEQDVRRLCIIPNATVDSVRQCVMSKFLRLGRRCQIEIASAGLAP